MEPRYSNVGLGASSSACPALAFDAILMKLPHTARSRVRDRNRNQSRLGKESVVWREKSSSEDLYGILGMIIRISQSESSVDRSKLGDKKLD